jgi:cell division protein FtsB
MTTTNSETTATTLSSLPQQESLSTIKNIIDELKEKIEQIEKELKDQGRNRKSPIYQEYADLISNYMPVEMVCDKICKHFPKDERIIRYALADKYKRSSKVRATKTEPETSTTTTKNTKSREIPTFEKNVIDECGKFSANNSKNVLEEQEKKVLDFEIENEAKAIQQLKDENAELKDRVDHLQQKIRKMQGYCSKIYDIIQRKEDDATIVCLIIDGSELLEVIDHYPKDEELKVMMEPSPW